jgi:hypothetical protein
LSDQKTELIDHINRSGFTELQKPDTLTTSGRINCNYHKYFSNMHLIPAKDGQFTPAWGGQGHWLFHDLFKFKRRSVAAAEKLVPKTTIDRSKLT